jgi:flagellar export protein FliJ
MSPKKVRIDRITKHRERQFNDQAANLQRTRNEHDAAEERARLEQERLREAVEKRNQLSQSTVSVAEWIEAESWVGQRAKGVARAEHELDKARTGLDEAQEQLKEAHVALKAMELVGQRLATAEHRKEETLERREQDELTNARGATGTRGRGRS